MRNLDGIVQDPRTVELGRFFVVETAPKAEIRHLPYMSTAVWYPDPRETLAYLPAYEGLLLLLAHRRVHIFYLRSIFFILPFNLKRQVEPLPQCPTFNAETFFCKLKHDFFVEVGGVE